MIPRATFGEVAESWFESKRHLRAWTRKSYRAALDRILLPRFGAMKVGAITPDQIAGLIRELERKDLAPATIANYLKPLAGTMAFAARRGIINVDPCTLLTRDDRPQRREREPDHVWSEDEMEALITAAEQRAGEVASRYDYSPLVRTALFTGLRLGELLGLTWKDVDLHDGVLHVERQWTRMGEYAPPKTAAARRRLPLSADMTQYLRELKLRSRYSADNDPVFASTTGKPLGHRNATRRGFAAAAKSADISGITFHSMRHAFASRMIDRGISSTVLAAIMGHDSSVITERRYIHLFDRQRTDDAVRDAMAR
jgi:integrase